MENQARRTFVKNLNNILSSKNIKQKPLADKMKLPLSTISSWVNGQSYPRVDKMQLLSDVLGVSMSDLTDDLTHSLSNSIVAMPIAGYGSCGNGFLNEEPIEWIAMPISFLGNKKDYENYFVAHADGKSMERAGIMDGSLLLFRKQDTLENNEIGVFHLNGREFVKKFKQNGNIAMLISESHESGNDPIVVTEQDDFRIIAKLFKCIINFE